MKCFIINYNRLLLPNNMAKWLAERGCEPIFIDNHSDYIPLLDYYATCPFQVVFMKKNFGHRVFWEHNLVKEFNIKGRYIVTDPDLDLTGIPNDFLQVLDEGLDSYNFIDKCGFSLEINDLPNSPEGNFIRDQCEVRYWKHKVGKFWKSPIDTTFAMYRKGVTRYTHTAYRTDRPYTAKHVPWYYTDLSLLSPDELYYYQTADVNFSTGKKRGFVK